VEDECGENEDGDDTGESNKRKIGPPPHLPKPKKAKMQKADTEIDGTLADVEALPPKVSYHISKYHIDIEIKPDISPKCIDVGIQTRRVEAELRLSAA
jgi:hypothetical protein